MILLKALQSLKHKSETRNPGETIVVEGMSTNSIFIIEEGWAIRYRILENGRRQILNFMLPGDCFDLMSLNQAKSDHSVSAVTKVKLNRVRVSDFLKAARANPDMIISFLWVAIQEEAILREQIIRVGRRSATERVAHLILELNKRKMVFEESSEKVVKLPIPQTFLADALGLSVVHISRTISKLKSLKFIVSSQNGITVIDHDGLVKLSGFEDEYLHRKSLKLAG